MADDNLMNGGDADAIAAEWTAMIEAAATANVPDTGVDRLLNQDEIDNLLGFTNEERRRPAARASGPSWIRRWSPTSVCRCSKSSSTGSSGC